MIAQSANASRLGRVNIVKFVATKISACMERQGLTAVAATVVATGWANCVISVASTVQMGFPTAIAPDAYVQMSGLANVVTNARWVPSAAMELCRPVHVTRVCVPKTRSGVVVSVTYVG